MKSKITNKISKIIFGIILALIMCGIIAPILISAQNSTSVIVGFGIIGFVIYCAGVTIESFFGKENKEEKQQQK